MLSGEDRCKVYRRLERYRCAQAIKRILRCLAGYMLGEQSRRTGICFPSLPTIAGALCLASKTIQRSLAWMAREGWIKYSPGKGRRVSRFEFLQTADLFRGVSGCNRTLSPKILGQSLYKKSEKEKTATNFRKAWEQLPAAEPTNESFLAVLNDPAASEMERQCARIALGVMNR